ncbi:MAG: hypothetical protein KY468_09580 [Armatimonadetes bacterium]|nr:hypothetical protein [Armatimonadota bacterium]
MKKIGVRRQEKPENRETPVKETVKLCRSPRKAVVIVTRMGGGDDSIAGERYRLELRRVKDKWRPAQLGRQVKCRPGRGHAYWSRKPCI